MLTAASWMFRRQVRTTVALMLSFIVEKADEMILPAGVRVLLIRP